MTATKLIFGAIMLLLLVGSVHADILGGQQLNESQVVIVPASDEQPTMLNISVLVFQPASSTGGTNIRDVMADIVSQCRSEGGDLQTCINQRALEITAASENYQMNLQTLENARVTVEYYNPQVNAWTAVQGCSDLYTNIPGTAYTPGAGGTQVAVTNYYTQCDISGTVAGAGRTSLRAVYLPADTDNIRTSFATYSYDNAQVNTDESFTNILNNTISGIAAAGGAGMGTSSLPCVGVFLILGLLLSSLYFAGKSPITLLDITTPRLPAPKGVTAGGQMLMPFGFSEMKRTTRAQMGAAVTAAGATASLLSNRLRGDSENRRLQNKIAGLSGTAADRAAGDVAEGRRVASQLVTLGRSLGMSGRDLEALAGRLPYHYGDAEHRTVARILEEAEARGGRHALMGQTLRQYVLGLRQYQTLETLTAHPEIGKRSYLHAKVSGALGKAVGTNRYAIIGGFVPGMLDSTVRTTRLVSKLAKASVTEAPTVARAATRTTMEMLGGRRAVEELGAKGRSSPAAAWLHDQLTKNPSKVVIGQAFPVSEKMGFLYKTLRDESNKDSMRYVLKQLYKRMGVNFHMSEEELASMGHVDMDILKKAGYHATPELLAMEREMQQILTNKSLDSAAKLNALTRLAESHGAHIDHQMLLFANKVDAIHTSGQEDHVKLIMLQEELERQNKVRMATMTGGHVNDDAYVCHVGGETLRGNQVWETMVLRTMIWDAENGHMHGGGIREELLSARLNTVNRLVGLDPSHAGAMEQLPEHMRNAGQLKAIAERNRHDMVELFTEEGRQVFAQTKGKSIHSASIAEIVNFMHGGEMLRTHDVDPKTGRSAWWGADMELGMKASYSKVDVKRHWVTELQGAENFAIAQWTESRFTRSYVPAFSSSIEAQLDRMQGSSSWSVEERTRQAKKLWVSDQLGKDMEQRFNSQFGQNAYGTTRETMRFYSGVLAGFMEKALEEKGLSANHPDMRFIKEMDLSNPQHLSQLKDLMQTHKAAYDKVVHRDVTYDDIIKSSKAMVMLHEGGLAYYHKGMMLSDADRVLGGQVSLRDNKGQLRAFVPEDVPIKFGARDDLQSQFNKLQYERVKDPNQWHSFIDATTKWAKEGGYSYEKEKVLASVLWSYANQTYDYSRFWQHSAVSVENKRSVTPVAPSVMRFFGSDGHTMSTVIKPFRDMGLHMGDYISRVALQGAGHFQRASYDITPTSEYYRQHSWRLASGVMSGQLTKGLTDAEQTAYRNLAMQHGAYHQVWDYAVDRNPWRTSTSFGTHQSWASFFHFGPAQNFSVKDNLGAYMSKGEYANFMTLFGFPMDLAGKMLRPYAGAIRGMQMSMQGYASKWDSTPDALRQWNYTEPRLREALQSMNPFSFKWFGGKTSERVAKLNVFGGSLEQHQLAGHEYLGGLRQAPQDIFLQRKGVYASARTGETNPGASTMDYRANLQYDAPMAEYMWRNKETSFIHDRKVEEAAMTNTQRRTVGAEALAMRREQELRGFGVMQNPLFGWANPLAFIWHTPVPLFPQSASPKDIVSKMVAKHKHGGGGGSWAASVGNVGESLARGTKNLMRPDLISRQVWCPRCSRSGMRGARCSCGQTLY
jgi:hypothetical protein